MILEIATFVVIQGQEAEYEAAITAAYPILASIDGYCSHKLQRCIEQPNKFVFLVYWETLEAHTVTFRESPQYQDWKARLHHFYEGTPSVEHFTLVNES
jgi:heme-degrading monooxygenase HmoA